MDKVIATLICVLFGALIPATQAALAAQPAFSGSQELQLLDNNDQRYPIGQIHFQVADAQGRIGYRLALDHHRFTDHFLSMKEMKCLQGPELWCHIPYPYDNPHWITPTDLRWLEHDQPRRPRQGRVQAFTECTLCTKSKPSFLNL